MIIRLRLVTFLLICSLTVKIAFQKSIQSVVLNKLEELEDCPVPLSIYRQPPSRTVNKLDENAIEQGLQKFPGIYSNLPRHIKTYRFLSEKAASQDDKTKVNALINFEELIYSILDVHPSDKQPDKNDDPFVIFKCPKSK